MVASYETRWGKPRTHVSDGSYKRDRRRSDAEERNAVRGKRTPAQQLQELDKRGVRALKERARLTKLVQK